MTSTTTAGPVTIDYGCPDWCKRTDHAADDLVTGEQAIHYAALEIESVSIQGRNDEPFGAYVSGDMDSTYVTGPDRLRQIAADALAAAEWMEAHQ